MAHEIIGAILAGGASSRMGTDKATLAIGGETILCRTARFLYGATGETPLIIGRTGNAPYALFAPDDTPRSGPLGGLATALRLAGGCDVVVVSCDLPALTPDAVRWLVAQRRGADGIITRNVARLEPLFAVYTAACLPRIAAHLAADKRSLHALIHASDGFAFADAPKGVADALLNVNTEQEWRDFLANHLA